MLVLLFEITKPAFGSKPCPYCNIEELDSSLFHHLMETHPYDHVLVQEDPAKISQLLVDIDSDSVYIAERFYVGLCIFRLFYIWMPSWVNIITFHLSHVNDNVTESIRKAKTETCIAVYMCSNTRKGIGNGSIYGIHPRCASPYISPHIILALKHNAPRA